MGHEVEEFKEEEHDKKYNLGGVIGPCRRRVLWMDKEVDCAEAHQNPIVGAVLEHVEEGHGIVGEAVDEQCLELTLQVMAQDHGEAKFLVESVRLVFAINLLPESHQKHCDQDGSKVLNKEYEFPRYLHPQILEDKLNAASLDLFRSQEVTEQHPLVAHCLAFWVTDRQPDSVNIYSAQL